MCIYIYIYMYMYTYIYIYIYILHVAPPQKDRGRGPRGRAGRRGRPHSTANFQTKNL